MYRPKPVTVMAVFWDGSQSEAGNIVEWVQSMGGTAEYFEANESDDHIPFISVKGADGDSDPLLPEEWLTWKMGNVYTTFNNDDFADVYELIQSPPG